LSDRNAAGDEGAVYPTARRKETGMARHKKKERMREIERRRRRRKKRLKERAREEASRRSSAA
jgi:hypothetical protein